MALAHELQHVIAAGLQPHVEEGQALVPQELELLVRPDLEGGGRGVAADPLALREELPDGIQDGDKVADLADQGVAVRQEDPAHIAVVLPGQVEVLQHLGQGAEGEALLLIHAAEGAGIVAAAVGHLDDEAVGLRGGAVNAAVISHFRYSSNAESFRQAQST